MILVTETRAHEFFQAALDQACPLRLLFADEDSLGDVPYRWRTLFLQLCQWHC